VASERGVAVGGPSVDRDERIYVIGDIHGRYDLLRDILDKVEDHSNALPPVASIHIVILGDMVDRGPDAASILRFLYNVQQRSDKVIVLLGNHEEMMLKALDGQPEMVRAWLRIGGDATLRSFGIEPDDFDGDARAIATQFRSAVPKEWVEWLRRLPLTARSGDYFFCHAGIRPGTAIKRQTRSDLLWIRDEFLYDETDHEAMVVHGHSISAEVEMKPNRIGIDTGAYRSGVLTALYLEGTRRQILATAGEATVAAQMDDADLA
jgi:serine/threonine protein phosphatase 1